MQNEARAQAQFEKQEAKIKHLTRFVERFRAKASKAKQAQSRLKVLEKMDVLIQAQANSPFSFEFFNTDSPRSPLIVCEYLHIGYEQDKPILRDIDFILNKEDRIALLGQNGAGKSTFIKALMGTFEPLKGNITKASKLKIGYYAQHQFEQLPLHLSPMEIILERTPKAREQEIRDFLGGFNFKGDTACNPITHFSGGEKSRLALLC